MTAFYSVSQAAAFFGVCTKTIRRWHAAGKINCLRTPGNHRRISSIEIQRVQQGKKWLKKSSKDRMQKCTAIYARVSSHEQKKKGDLERQIESAKTYCKEKGYGVGYTFSDIGSGLNGKRKGLQSLMRGIEKGKICRVIISYSDRLTRFGFEYLQSCFSSHGSKIEVINKSKIISAEQEMVDDLIALITSFSGKVHGMRGKRKKTKKLMRSRELVKSPNKRQKRRKLGIYGEYPSVVKY